MVDVELVDELPDRRVADGSGDLVGARPRPRSVTRRQAWLAAAVVLAVLGIVLAGTARDEQVDLRADDALLAAFADVPGISGSLRDPSAAAVRAAEPSPAPYTGPSAECPWPITDGALRVCRVFGEPGHGGPTTDAVLGGTPDRLVVLATRDGRVVAERDLGPTAIGWSVLGDDLVVATREGEVAAIERAGATGGEVRWRTSVPLPRDVLARQMQLVADEFVVLSGPVAAVLDAESGELIGTWATVGGGPAPVRVVTSDVGFAVWTADDEGVWFDRSGAAGAYLPGTPVAPVVADGSHPGVLLLTEGEVLRAVDVHAGVLWERTGVLTVRVRLGDIVVLEDARGVQAVELATGAELWSVAGVTAAPGGEVRTDGVRLLLAPRDTAPTTDPPALSAYTLRDGSLAWTTP